MKKYALIFPGQGAQKMGMGKDLFDNSKAAKHVFETADNVLGRSISGLCFNGSDEDLAKTINSQPCILAVEIALYEALKEIGNIDFVATAGHSLGEYAALYASGVIDLKTAFLLISKRAELMNDIAVKSFGGMAAVLGLDDSTVKSLVEELENVYVANFNYPGQVVITGDKDAINNSIDKFKSAGAKKVIPLAVSGAFHSPYMEEAGKLFDEYVKQFILNNADKPVYTNVDAFSTTFAEDFMNKIPKQIYSSVLWTDTINNMINDGIVDFIELGPKSVLSGMNKKISAEITTLIGTDCESINSIVTELQKEEELV